MNKTVLYTEYGVEFFASERGGHFLSVLVGGIAQYEITVKLTAEELELYREFGDHYVKKLAVDICRAPETFRSRHIAVD